MTSIAMSFFVANMERKLRLLFAPLNAWALDYDFDLGEIILFPVIDETLLAEYRAARSQSQEYETIKKNVDTLLSVPKEQEQQRRHELE